MVLFIYIILFFLFIFSFFVISSRNPVHSVLSLISVFLLSAALLLCLEVEFLALSFVIVYVGAIAILFLFVVMMLDVKIGDNSFDFLRYGSLSYFISFIFLLEITKPLTYLTFFSSTSFSTNYLWIRWFTEIDYISNIQTIGQLLYTYYFVFFFNCRFYSIYCCFGCFNVNFDIKQKNQNLKLKFF
jgi:NADH-quinone oxidoreductase subunit J